MTSISHAVVAFDEKRKSVVSPNGFKPDPNSPFFMSTPEFQALQTYCESAKKLPTTADELVARITGMTAAGAKEFPDMLAAYAIVKNHCAEFTSETFPKTVSLAATISRYGRECSETYFPALIETIQKWQSETDPGKQNIYQRKVDGILKNRADQAQEHANNAKSVLDLVVEFLDQTKSDKNTLEPIQKKYHDKYEKEGGIIADLKRQLKEAQDAIDKLNDEYKQDVIVASTTPTYGWVWPFGTIAAAVVAGVYGKRATAALDRIEGWKKKKGSLSDELQKDTDLVAQLTLADNSVKGLLEALNGALPVLEKMQGIWQSLHDDIAGVVGTLTEAKKADVWVKDNIVDAAAKQWKAVSDAADNYRVNAFVTFKALDQISKSDVKGIRTGTTD